MASLLNKVSFDDNLESKKDYFNPVGFDTGPKITVEEVSSLTTIVPVSGVHDVGNSPVFVDSD